MVELSDPDPFLEIDSSVIRFGGGGPKVFEHPNDHLTISRVTRIQWFRERIKIDSAELAKLRWSEGWKINQLAAHFRVGTTFLKKQLAKI